MSGCCYYCSAVHDLDIGVKGAFWMRHAVWHVIGGKCVLSAPLTAFVSRELHGFTNFNSKTFPPLEISVKSLQAHQHLWYLRFSQLCWWRFKSSWKWCCVVSHVLPEVLKDWVISSWTAWFWRWKHSDSLKAGDYLLNTASQPESLNMQRYTFQIWNHISC